MKRRAAWWLCLGVLGGLLSAAPVARAQGAPLGDVADESGPVDAEREPAPSEPAPEQAPPLDEAPPQPEPEVAEPAQLESPDWDEGEDRPAQLEHTEAPPATEPTSAADVGVACSDDLASDRAIEPFLFELGGIGGLLYHRLTYRDDLYGFLRPYSLANAKEAGGYVTAYPLSRMDLGMLGGLGVELRYTHMFTFDSLRSDGSSFPTRSRELVAGVRYRIDHRALLNRGIEASVGFGGGGHTFDIGSALALPNVDNRAAVPSRHYRFLRVDAATRVALDLGFFLSMHIGVRMITSAGDVDRDEWFPRGRRWGLESGLHLGYVLPKGLEISLGFEAQRYMYRLNPEPGDSNVVGGLLDRYVHAQVRAGWRF